MLWPIMKKDLSMNKIYFIAVLFLLPILHAGDAGNIGIYSYMLLFSTYYPFYTEFHNKMNRFMVSLPVSRKRIVFIRYVTIILLLFTTVAMHFFIDFLLSRVFPKVEFTSIDPLMLPFIVLFLSILISIILPIYFQAKSFILGFSVNFCVLLFAMIVGFGIVNSIDVPVFLKRLSVSPFILLLTVSGLSLYASYRISVHIFSKKDL